MKFLCSILYGLSFFVVVVSSSAESNSVNEYVNNTYYFKDIAIHEVNEIGASVVHKIIVQSVNENIKMLRSNARESYKLPPPEQILWTITGDQLNLIKEDYIKYDVDPCDESYSDHPKCYKSYIFYGPEYLAFDEKAGIIYLSAPLNGGNAGWPIIIYAANIKTKEVKPLALEGGPVQASLSPSGKYLVLYWGHLGIINTQTGEDFKVKEPVFTKAGKLQMVYVYYGDIKWLDDHTLQFTKTEKLGKFSTDPSDYVVTKILDIRSKTTKIVN